MKIGDKVWVVDLYRRNREFGVRGSFVERYILGETRVSWIVGYKGWNVDHVSNIKVNKKKLTYVGQDGYMNTLYTSEEQINKHCWVQENRHKISHSVGCCYDYDTLKQIADIIGYEE